MTICALTRGNDGLASRYVTKNPLQPLTSAISCAYFTNSLNKYSHTQISLGLYLLSVLRLRAGYSPIGLSFPLLPHVHGCCHGHQIHPRPPLLLEQLKTQNISFLCTGPSHSGTRSLVAQGHSSGLVGNVRAQESRLYFGIVEALAAQKPCIPPMPPIPPLPPMNIWKICDGSISCCPKPPPCSISSRS